MTTKEDWEFRARYFRDKAKALRKKAHEMECEAAEYDESADNAEKAKDMYGYTQYTGYRP